MDTGSSRTGRRLSDRPGREFLVALVAAMSVGMLMAAAPVSAATPAAIDQYVESGPNNLGNPGGDGGGKRDGDKAGDGNVTVLEPGVPSVGAVVGQAGDPRATREFRDDPEPSAVETGGGEVPLINYPLTPLVLIMLALLAAGSAARLLARRVVHGGSG